MPGPRYGHDEVSAETPVADDRTAQETLAYLHGLQGSGIRLGLETIHELAARLGNPHRAFRVVHVAGTNGKGSVVAFVEQALRAAGHSTAAFVSPALHSFRDQILVNGAPVAWPAFARAVDEVRQVTDDELRPTQFEALTAAAFVTLRNAGVGIGVIEVGVGGDSDATNIVTSDVGAITAIDFDHVALLGSRLEDIARHKAGIIKPGMTAVAGNLPTEAMTVIERKAADTGARLIRAAEDAVVTSVMHEGYATMSVRTPHAEYRDITLALRGEHQIENALVAIRVLEAMAARGVAVSTEAIVGGLTHARWPARLEMIEVDDRRRVLLDAAHNPHGAAALAAYLRDWHPERPALVVGMMRDKDADAILRLLLPAVSSVFATAAPIARALTPDELIRHIAAASTEHHDVIAVGDPGDAVMRALEQADTVCVAGSIFLAGAVRDALGRRAILRLIPPKFMVRTFLFSCFVCLLAAVSAQGQTPATATPAPAQPSSLLLKNLNNAKQWTFDQISQDHVRLTGQVDIDMGAGTRFFADQVDLFTDTNKLVATGNVVFTNTEGRIAAETVEFDTVAGTGTFHQAFGLMSLGPKADRKQFGNQDPDVYFYGDVIDKLGPRRYRITRGGFTTCVQPTPRWELVSGSVMLNLNEYALARNTVLKVKGVPLMYLPVVYYPIQSDDRATGFLLPTYGTSTIRGQALSNAFFWAIDRSQDATFFHDWFTRAGQGEGAEYRYIAAAQSYGNFKLYRFSRNETTLTSNDTTQILPAATSYSVIGSAVHAFGTRVRARARVDYFSDVANQQLLQQNLYQATQRSRIIEAGATAGLGQLSTSAVYQRNEVFSSASTSDTIVYGSTPRLTASLAPQRLFNSPVYASMNAEYAFLPYEQVSEKTVANSSFARIDASPTLRVPLSRLTFLSVNTSAAFRTTYYTRSFLDDNTRTLTDDSFLRRYASLRTEVVGPIFTRIWDTPDSGFAERFKHVIEPAFTVDTTSPISDYRRTPFTTDISDLIVGGATRMTYGLTNRVFYRGKAVDGGRGQTREFVTVGLQQTYYSNPASSQSDTAYQSTQGATADLSPIALSARISPSSRFDANSRLEYNVSGNGLTVFSVGSSINGESTSGNVNFSRRRADRNSFADDTLNGAVRTQLMQRRMTATYSMSWDIGRGYIQTQSLMATYLAQCCGFQVEFQKYNFQGTSIIGADRRFNFGFVLAGLGTFSNFFGAFGGQR